MVIAFVEAYDNSATNVLEWLKSIEPSLQIKTLDENDCLYPLHFLIDNESHSHQLGGLPETEVTFYYYRRGKFKSLLKASFDQFQHESYDWLRKEEETIFEFWENQLTSKKHYGSILTEKNTNKLTNLLTAKNSGLMIPRTLITTSKSSLVDFMAGNPKGTILKPIRNHKPLTTKRNVTFSPVGTQLLTAELINNLENEFFPCLFQEYIPKQYELRVFYYRNLVYSMAIFSQSNPKTQIDFRNYDRAKPNRCVPFKIPATIEASILEFSRLSNFDTGSIDILVSTVGDYYFLEVNHSGHYEWLSYNCNYYIDKYIAFQIYEEIQSQDN